MPEKRPDPRCLALGQNIKKIREKKGLTQEQLAEKADVHLSYIGQIERGIRYPSLKVLFKIADGMEVRVSDLFAGIKWRQRKR
jgi:transcriptional regulator with XRE-family HTH domain